MTHLASCNLETAKGDYRDCIYCDRPIEKGQMFTGRRFSAHSACFSYQRKRAVKLLEKRIAVLVGARDQLKDQIAIAEAVLASVEHI
jgi:hypothetical protein